MRILDDDLWFCVDCTMLAVNGEAPENKRAARACAAGLKALHKDGQHVSSNSNDEEGEEDFSRRTCDCCGSSLAGHRSRFALFTKAPMPAIQAGQLQHELTTAERERDALQTKLDAAEETIAELRDTIAELRPIAERGAAGDLLVRWTLERTEECHADA